jgi:hypothetical protein
VTKRFLIKVNTEDGYRFRLLSSRDVETFSFRVDEVNCYNDKSGDDEIFIVSDANLAYQISSCGSDEFQVGFHGWIELDLDKSQYRLLSLVDFEVDYNLEILFDNEPLEQDSDYELVHNKRFYMSDVSK